MKKVLVVLAVVLGMAVGIFALCAMERQDKPENCDFSEEYKKETISAVSVEIFDKPNVRSEPKANSSVDSAGTSYGKIKSDVKIPVEQIVTEHTLEYKTVMNHYGQNVRQLDWAPYDSFNGYFYGVYVSDITKISGWEEIFPKTITNDPDGIVWINEDYISINKGDSAKPPVNKP